MRVREEQGSDHSAVHELHRVAFNRVAEADLVDALRREARPIVSLVAEDDGRVVGHILFTPVSISAYPRARIMGLAPMAVLPEQQRSGIGSALVRAGLEACRRLGYGAIVVLGHPAYYPRFGFAPAAKFGLDSDYDAGDAFMALELQSGALDDVAGRIHFHDAFRKL